MANIVHWVSPDQIWGVVKAGDVPPGVARSKTRDDPADAQNATWDPGLTTPVGPGSTQKYVKVKLADLAKAQRAKPASGLKVGDLKPGNYANPSNKGKFIPEYPHTCAVCGGKMLILFSSQEHEGGIECPGPKQRELFGRRR